MSRQQKNKVDKVLYYSICLIMITFLICVCSYKVKSKLIVQSKSTEKQERNSSLSAGVCDVIMIEENIVTTSSSTVGWTTTRVNVRKEPNTNSSILTTLNFNTQIEYYEFNQDWVKIKYENQVAYISKKYISPEECNYIEYEVPAYAGFKSYMGYKCITRKTSKQYLIQKQYAYTGEYGIRQVEGRFCVALGSYFKTSIGQYFDLILKNGTIIPCIMGDAKADKDTDSNNLFTRANKCCSEFIIDTSALDNKVKLSGNISNVTEEWKSPVQYIRVYNTNILDE